MIFLSRNEKVRQLEYENCNFNNAPDFIQNLLRGVFKNELDAECFEDAVFSMKEITMERYKYLHCQLNDYDKYILFRTGDSTAIKRVPIENVIEMLTVNGFTKKELVCFLLAFYGDGTVDGSGKEKLSTTLLKKCFRKEIAIVNKAMHRIKSQIIDFVLFQMPNGSSIDGLLYINPNGELLYVSKDEIERYVQKKEIEKTSVLNVSFVGIQSFSRLSSVKKDRDSVQFKLHHVEKTIKEINCFMEKKVGGWSVASGFTEEQVRTVQINKNRTLTNRQFAELIDNAKLYQDISNIENVYAVQLLRCYSLLDDSRKVKTKTDVLLIETKVNIDGLLMANGFFLSDNMLEHNNIEFRFLEGTGISVKRGNRTTLSRMSIDTAQQYFNKKDLVDAALFRKNDFSLIYNRDMYEQCGLNPDDAPVTREDVDEKFKSGYKNIFEKIENDLNTKHILITGQGLFDRCLVAHYMMWDGELKKIDIRNLQMYYNSTGSKRHNFCPIFQSQKSSFRNMKSVSIFP